MRGPCRPLDSTVSTSTSLLCGNSGAEGGDLTPGVQEDQSIWRSGLKRLGRVIRGPCRPLYRTAHEYGPPWCRCTLPEPAWLRQEQPEPWHTVSKALILGGPESETPLLCLFWPIFLFLNWFPWKLQGHRAWLAEEGARCALAHGRQSAGPRLP